MEIEKEILSGCRKNERAAQQQLYSMTYSSLLPVCKRYLYNEQDAFTALNNAMFKVFTRIEQFGGDENNFFGWIKRIVINESIDQVRKKENFFSLEELPGHEQISCADEARDEKEIDIHYLLSQLPLLSATVFNMFVIEGYSHREISQALNITEGNSKWHLYSSRRKLQNLLTVTTVGHE